MIFDPVILQYVRADIILTGRHFLKKNRELKLLRISWDTNLAAVFLLWDTRMVRVTSREGCFPMVLSISFSGFAGYISSSKAFIYSLKDYYGYGYFKKDVTISRYAIYSDYHYGPTFGGGHDIYVANNAGYNYNSNCGCHSYSGRYCNGYIFTGSGNFRPSNLEVYYEAFSA